jgi:hypothetical protein
METLCQFRALQAEWKKYLAWFMDLPLFLEMEEFRVVHASWVTSEIEKIRTWTSGNLVLNEELLHKSANKGSDEYNTIEALLKGVEIALPKGETFEDKDKNERDQIRVRWWEPAANKTYGEMVFPSKSLDCKNEIIAEEEASKLEVYNDHVPVFFGHYWIDPEEKPRTQADQICCLDYSVAKDGKLVAYRWENESKLHEGHFYLV